MITVKKRRYRDRKTVVVSLVLAVVMALLFVVLEPSSAFVGSLFGAIILGPLLRNVVWGQPALRITNGEKTCDLVFWYDANTPVLSVLEDGYSSRELYLKEPIETAVCDTPTRVYLTPTKLGTIRVVVEIEGEKYYLP